LTAERARQRTALLFGQMPPELDLASMRAQRQRDAARSGAVHNHLRPEAIELEAAGPAGFPSFEQHAVPFDRDGLEVSGVALDAAESDEQHEHLRPRERQHEPGTVKGERHRYCEAENDQ